MAEPGAEFPWAWPPALSIRTMRGRAAAVFILVVSASIALCTALTAAQPLSLADAVWSAMCAGVLIACWVWIDSEAVRPGKALAEIAWAFSHGGEEVHPRGHANEEKTAVSLWSCVDTFAGALHAQTHTFDDALAVERIVLREVNHRIRNNLQMVASILTIQARADESLGAVRAHDRIQLLSLAHDRIYASGDVHDVRLDDLAAEIGRTLLSARGGLARGVQLELALSPARARSEAAVPMAFLMGESLSHALDVLGPVGAAVLVMTLQTDADGSILYALSSQQTPESRTLNANAGRVMDAFAHQLDAEIAHSQSGPEIVRIRLKPGDAVDSR